MKTVNVGGVPEHFNLPWHITLNKEEYKKQNINLKWHDYADGTGAMCQALRSGDIDVAIILTEGIIKDIIAGNPSAIIQTYVKTPLVWGVHVAEKSKYNNIEDVRGTKAAISRYGSGSHLMAYINAEKHKWNLNKDLDFEVIKDLNGAIKGLTEGNADYFLWEKFTTKPLVDDGVFRRIADCPTPWPCFVIAARKDFIKSNKKELQAILSIINKTTAQLKNTPDIDQVISTKYGQQLSDVRDWLTITEWSQKLIKEDVVMHIQKELFALKIIPEIVSYESLTYKL
ncbi:substrate-binding domain-containing protein [Algibacter mikhailovii]|uniref:substrate-binding domain-containing protein n=1 Tax=Algibacter mikhailovii TaxID=425498 RepID=UPI00249455CC|nr:substrate-binding domain-containing protein [Algibacter mikhailovii]